ncbi:MAG: NAD(P)/FAD-dependent oxidoreductase [Pseudomonadota bacterium]
MSRLDTDILDVLIIGAGISGIGCACHLSRELPEKTWAIVEARDDLGGTWDLFKYPGIRSDSDLYTFSYDFKPWASPNSIASASEIMDYLRETADEYGVTDKIKYRHRVVSANWDSDIGLWTLVVQGPSGLIHAKCRWVFSATGYYDYEEAFRPEFPGESSFAGDLIHPQFWPENYEYAGKRVAIIGSGATAITLLPEMAETAEHVTQIQRTPSYVLARPKQDGLAKFLKAFLPAKTIHAIMRWKNTRVQRYFYLFCQRFPERARRLIRKANTKLLPDNYAVDTHFSPPYNPWDQRLCAAPDGDFFDAIRNGNATIETGEIDQLEANGVRMKSGELVLADTVIVATGLKLKMLGNIPLHVDGEIVDIPSSLVFRGMMLSDVPNFAFAIGYTNSSWTLKVDILCRYLCDLIKAMDVERQSICVPVAPGEVAQTRPLLDFKAGYVLRALDELPKQGEGYPWEMTLNYMADRGSLKKRPVLDPALTLRTPGRAKPTTEAEAA